MPAGRGDVLAEILRTKRDEVTALRPRLAELRARALDRAPARPFAAALRDPEHVRLLAEVKRRSPSAGAIRAGAAPAEIAAAYERGGAAALSVLTDVHYFDGSLEALEEARSAVTLPVLRKDFVVDEVQLWEARAAGADAVLLIARALRPSRLAELHGVAREAGLDVLVEVHEAAELEAALAAGAELIGINNRDLRTFRTDLSRTIELAPSIPASVTLVAESGIRTADDVDRLGEAGVDAILVGEGLMREADVSSAAARICDRPRRPRPG